MRRFFQAASTVAASALALSVVVAPAAAKSEKAPGPQRPIQLSLGDSWAAGAVDPDEGGYVNRLYDDLREQYDCRVSGRSSGPARCKKLKLRNISRGGATTSSLLANQLPVAVELLERRNGDRRPTNDVEVITVTIGGNDIFGPVLSACSQGVTEQCRVTIAIEFMKYRINLTQILDSLRTSAGPRTDIVTTAYDNPIPTCNLGAVGLGPLGALVLEGGPGLPLGLNDVTRDVADQFDVRVAETFGSLAPTDWVGGADCLHPNGPGHEKVKDAFLVALGL